MERLPPVEQRLLERLQRPGKLRQQREDAPKKRQPRRQRDAPLFVMVRVGCMRRTRCGGNAWRRSFHVGKTSYAKTRNPTQVLLMTTP